MTEAEILARINSEVSEIQAASDPAGEYIRAQHRRDALIPLGPAEVREKLNGWIHSWHDDDAANRQLASIELFASLGNEHRAFCDAIAFLHSRPFLSRHLCVRETLELYASELVNILSNSRQAGAA